MDEKAIASKRQNANGRVPSMKRRSDINDYHGRHVYLLTLAVEGRRPLLGQLLGDPSLPPGHRDAPHVHLTPLGQEVMRCWSEIPRRHPEVQVLAFQMMPDHLHGILFVKEEMEQHLGQVISGFKAGCNKAYRRLYLEEAVPPPTPKERCASGSPLSSGAGSLLSSGAGSPSSPSSLSAQGAASPLPSSPLPSSPFPSSLLPSSLPSSPLPLPSECRLKPDDRRHGLLFERGYNDLIARGYDMLPRLIAYVHDNPRRLLLKRQHPEWLRPFFGLKLGGAILNGIGNLSLLLAPHRKAVRVSRRLTEIEIAKEAASYLMAAQAGTVLISPAISPGEKQVMRSSFSSHLPTIVIVPNGFTPFSKPHGEQFEACVAGRLLMLSPWPHHNEKQPLTRTQCNDMNLLAYHLSLCSADEVRVAIAAVTSQP